MTPNNPSLLDSSSSGQVEQPNKKKRTSSQTDQAAVVSEDALRHTWAMLDEQISQSMLLVSELRKMRKVATAVLEQNAQVKKEQDSTQH